MSSDKPQWLADLDRQFSPGSRMVDGHLDDMQQEWLASVVGTPPPKQPYNVAEAAVFLWCRLQLSSHTRNPSAIQIIKIVGPRLVAALRESLKELESGSENYKPLTVHIWDGAIVGLGGDSELTMIDRGTKLPASELGKMLVETMVVHNITATALKMLKKPPQPQRG